MTNFVIKTISNADLENEIINIGYDRSYAFKGADKFRYQNFKIFGVTCAQGNILKQTALSVGADCATNKDVITGKAELSDCILGGNFSQLAKISQKLQLQPFGLKDLGRLIEDYLKGNSNLCHSELVSESVKKLQTKIVGVLNLTTDSFSDGGKYYNFEDAVAHLKQLINDGADIIDIGAESTKPYSLGVSAEQQLEKIVPVLNYIKENNIKIPISIDTRSSEVASECIRLGASIINDVSGFDYDKNMADVIAKNQGIKVIIQHSKGTPENMQDNPVYKNLIDEIYLSLNQKIDYAVSKGIKKENIIVDPGIGFGKTKEDNFEILRRWKEFRSLGCPVMIGLSRKSLLGMPDASNEDKDLYSLALDSILINDGVDYLRVHNVKIHRKFQDIIGS